MASRTPSALLAGLEALEAQYGPGLAERKLELIHRLERARLGNAAHVLRAHEALCFLRAYPDDARVLAAVEAGLERFAKRPDLRAHRADLADSGISGTPIYYPLFWPMARWLTERWPERLEIDWPAVEDPEPMRRALQSLVPEALRPALSTARSLERFLASMRGSIGDGAWLVRAIERMPGDDRTREAFHDTLDTPYRLAPAADRPCRTLARHTESPVCFVQSGLTRRRPELTQELRRAPLAIRKTDRVEGQDLVDLANEAMVTRSRDLEAFGFGNPEDVHMVDDHGGLQFALIGVRPERRLLLPAAFGLVSLQSGVPVGYIQVDVLGRAAEISFNTFETFRGGEAALVFARMLACTRYLFGAETFSIEPYQLGEHNKEAIQSGAFWFYAKMGFRPEAKPQLRVLERELRAMARDPKHRSNAPTLSALAGAHVFYDFAAKRRARPPASVLFERISSALVRSSLGSDAVHTARARLSVPPRVKLSVDERSMLARWSPIVAALPGLEKWPANDRKAAFELILSKAGPDERSFIERYRAHRKLDSALRALAGLS